MKHTVAPKLLSVSDMRLGTVLYPYTLLGSSACIPYGNVSSLDMMLPQTLPGDLIFQYACEVHLVSNHPRDV